MKVSDILETSVVPLGSKLKYDSATNDSMKMDIIKLDDTSRIKNNSTIKTNEISD
jgi:hypothetical protein